MEKAQDELTLNCDIFVSLYVVKWKCLDCKEWLCYSCKTAHTKSKLSKDHHIDSLMDADIDSLMDADAAEQLQIKHRLCTVHTIESICMYCIDC